MSWRRLLASEASARAVATVALVGLAVATGAPTAAAQPADPAAPAAPSPGGHDGDDGDAPRVAPTGEEVGGAPVVPELTDVWTEWDVEPATPGGRLLEDKETVRALLEPDMKTRQALTPNARDDLVAAAARIGYQLVRIDVQRPEPGVVRAVLLLEPRLVVRRVEVDVDQLTRVSIKEELTRRMRLRVGEVLEVEDEARNVQLRDEAERLREFLQDEGFFEATVAIRVARSGVYGALLTVDARLGPEYHVGTITIVNERELAIPGAELRRVFDHCAIGVFGWCVRRARFTRAQHKADLARIAEMYQKRGYPAVRVQSDFDPRSSFQRDELVVDFTLRIDERRRLAVEFEGNDPAVFPDEELMRQLTFDAASSADDLEVAASAAAIQRAYQARGWFDAAVSWERERARIEGAGGERGERSLDRVTYRIDAGPRRTLRSVEIAGAAAIPQSELRGVIVTAPPSGSFRLLGATTAVTSEQLAADAERIVQRYRERGYLDAKVQVHAAPAAEVLGDAAATAALIGAERDRGDLHVRFAIDEGPRTVIERIDVVFEGPHVASREEVVARLGVRPGDPFLATRVQDGLAELATWYFRIGKPRAKVAMEPTPIAGDPHRLALTYTVEERQALRVGKIVVRGNFRTQDWVVKRELGLEEGQLLTSDALGRGVRRLRATGLFAAVDVKMINFEETREDTINLIVEVEERKDHTLYIEAEGGYSTQRSLYLGLAPVFPNLRGVGISFEARATTSLSFDKYQSFEGLARVPRWWMREHLVINPDVDLSLFWRRQDTERFGQLTTFGGGLAASRVWQRAGGEGKDGRSIAATLRYDFRRRTRQEDAVRLAGNNGNVSRSTVYNRTGTIGFVLSWEQRVDAAGNLNPLAPHRGFKLEAGVGLANPYLLSQDSFVKLSGLGQWIRQLSDRVQFRIEGRYDQGFPLGGAVLLPEVERFFAGGDDTVRGYDEDRLAVEIVEAPVPPFMGITQVEVLPAGGNIRLLASADLQVKLWKLGSLPVASALFVDAGAITNTWSALDAGDVRPSVGIALARLLTPFGGLSLEWAVPIRPREVDPPLGRLHFLVALRY